MDTIFSKFKVEQPNEELVIYFKEFSRLKQVSQDELAPWTVFIKAKTLILF